MYQLKKKTANIKKDFFSRLFDNNNNHDNISATLAASEKARKASETCIEEVNKTIKETKHDDGALIQRVDLKLAKLKKEVACLMLQNISLIDKFLEADGSLRHLQNVQELNMRTKVRPYTIASDTIYTKINSYTRLQKCESCHELSQFLEFPDIEKSIAMRKLSIRNRFLSSSLRRYIVKEDLLHSFGCDLLEMFEGYRAMYDSDIDSGNGEDVFADDKNSFTNAFQNEQMIMASGIDPNNVKEMKLAHCQRSVESKFVPKKILGTGKKSGDDFHDVPFHKSNRIKEDIAVEIAQINPVIGLINEKQYSRLDFNTYRSKSETDIKNASCKADATSLTMATVMTRRTLTRSVSFDETVLVNGESKISISDNWRDKQPRILEGSANYYKINDKEWLHDKKEIIAIETEVVANEITGDVLNEKGDRSTMPCQKTTNGENSNDRVFTQNTSASASPSEKCDLMEINQTKNINKDEMQNEMKEKAKINADGNDSKNKPFMVDLKTEFVSDIEITSFKKHDEKKVSGRIKNMATNNDAKDIVVPKKFKEQPTKLVNDKKSTMKVPSKEKIVRQTAETLSRNEDVKTFNTVTSQKQSLPNQKHLQKGVQQKILALEEKKKRNDINNITQKTPTKTILSIHKATAESKHEKGAKAEGSLPLDRSEEILSAYSSAQLGFAKFKSMEDLCTGDGNQSNLKLNDREVSKGLALKNKKIEMHNLDSVCDEKDEALVVRGEDGGFTSMRKQQDVTEQKFDSTKSSSNESDLVSRKVKTSESGAAKKKTSITAPNKSVANNSANRKNSKFKQVTAPSISTRAGGKDLVTKKTTTTKQSSLKQCNQIQVKSSKTAKINSTKEGVASRIIKPASKESYSRTQTKQKATTERVKATSAASAKDKKISTDGYNYHLPQSLKTKKQQASSNSSDSKVTNHVNGYLSLSGAKNKDFHARSKIVSK